MNLSITVKFNEAGEIDRGATEREFWKAFDQYRSERQDVDLLVSVALDRIFQEYPETRLNMGFVVSESLRRMGATPSNYQVWEERVRSYLKINSQGNKVGDSVERPTSKYITTRGTGGGIALRK